MASTVWKGHLTFGLISVPVRLTVAARSKRMSFNMVNPETMSRVKQQLWDPVSEKVVSRKELAKEMQRLTHDLVSYVPMGQSFPSVGIASNLEGYINGPVPFFWNLKRAD